MKRLTTHSVLNYAAVVALGVSGLAASAAFSSAGAAMPHAGRINVDEVGTISVPDHSVVITGAFADSGTYAPPSSNGAIELVLSKGTIKVDDSKGAAKESQLYAHITKYLNAATCGLALSYTATATLTSGTGAYAGITGTVTISAHDSGVFPKTTAGACNTNANPVGFIDIGIGSGSISFG